MAAPKYIPGPYTFDADEGHIEAEVGVIVAHTPAVDDFPCREVERDEEFEAELVATGYMLAAAPDLHRQLSGIVAFAEAIIQGIGVDPDITKLRVIADGEDFATITMTEMLDRARAAIAKAEGRA